jgi:hypothetical protein
MKDIVRGWTLAIALLVWFVSCEAIRIVLGLRSPVVAPSEIAGDYHAFAVHVDRLLEAAANKRVGIVALAYGVLTYHGVVYLFEGLQSNGVAFAP